MKTQMQLLLMTTLAMTMTAGVAAAGPFIDVFVEHCEAMASPLNGQPVADVEVEVYKVDGSTETLIGEGETESDGWVRIDLTLTQNASISVRIPATGESVDVQVLAVTHNDLDLSPKAIPCGFAVCEDCWCESHEPGCNADPGIPEFTFRSDLL